MSGASGAVSNVHTRQSEIPGGAGSQGSPPTPFRFWSSRFPETSFAVVANRTVYRVPGFRGVAGAKVDVFRVPSWVHAPCVCATTPSE